MGSPSALTVTDRTTLRRRRERGTYERTEVERILDEALVAHVGVISDATPVVLPMAHARIDGNLYLHGAAANHLLSSGRAAPVCVTVTLLDGLVLARSAYHHSMNFRCVVLYGEAEPVTDPAEKKEVLEALVEHVVPGRLAEIRPPSDIEVKATSLLRLPIDEGSAKVRTGGPVEEPEDLALPVWAGVIPLGLAIGEPVSDYQLAPGTPVPPHVAEYSRTS